MWLAFQQPSAQLAAAQEALVVVALVAAAAQLASLRQVCQLSQD